MTGFNNIVENQGYDGKTKRGNKCEMHHGGKMCGNVLGMLCMEVLH